MRIKLLFVVATLIGLGSAAWAATDVDHTALIERLQKLGEVCIDDSCSAAAMAVSESTSVSAAMSGEEVYQSSCFACHGTGLLDSPTLGSAEQWAPRIEKGLEVLVQSTIKGLNDMPEMGACANCSEEDIATAVEYMVEQSQ